MSPGCSKDNPGWGRDQIDEVIRSGDRVDVKLTTPVPVYWVYITAWATPDGDRAVPPRHLSARRRRARARSPPPFPPSRSPLPQD